MTIESTRMYEVDSYDFSVLHIAFRHLGIMTGDEVKALIGSGAAYDAHNDMWFAPGSEIGYAVYPQK